MTTKHMSIELWNLVCFFRHTADRPLSRARKRSIVLFQRLGPNFVRISNRETASPRQMPRSLGFEPGLRQQFYERTWNAPAASGSGGGNEIQRRSVMLRWQASANCTSRMPAAKSDGIGAPVAT